MTADKPIEPDAVSRNEVREIQKAIAVYADAYGNLEGWQSSSTLIPKGDQKTGPIAEFYATLYLRAKYPNATLTNGHHSQGGWDIEVDDAGRKWKVQVKAVSEWSETKRMSPIHENWDELFVFYLSKKFLPIGFWVIEDNSIVPKGAKLKNRTCPRPGVAFSGSQDIPFGENRIEELRTLTSKWAAL